MPTDSYLSCNIPSLCRGMFSCCLSANSEWRVLLQEWWMVSLNHVYMHFRWTTRPNVFWLFPPAMSFSGTSTKGRPACQLDYVVKKEVRSRELLNSSFLVKPLCSDSGSLCSSAKFRCISSGNSLRTSTLHQHSVGAIMTEGQSSYDYDMMISRCLPLLRAHTAL